jgi:F-type H+-transporting ATPase subunit delta
MSVNPLASKIATPYARALYDFSVEQNLMHQITADFQNLEVFLTKTPELTKYLNNPVISLTQKEKFLTKILKSQLNSETFKFLMVLVKRDRINLLLSIIICFLELVYKTASVKMIEVSTAFPFTTLQKLNLIKKLKELTNAREIRLVVTLDSSLIGGFLIKTNSKVINFTIKNQLENLAKHLAGGTRRTISVGITVKSTRTLLHRTACGEQRRVLRWCRWVLVARMIILTRVMV